jgi:molecular chaperone GrpE (heat shock protein)
MTPPEAGRDRRIEDLVALLKQIEQFRSELAESDRRAKEQMKGFLLELVEVMDACDTYFASIQPREAEAEALAQTWLGYFRRVHRKLERALERFGVSRIRAADGKALPGYHTIEESRPAPGAEDDTILEESKKGYLWRGEVLRKAIVVTARAE